MLLFLSGGLSTSNHDPTHVLEGLIGGYQKSGWVNSSSSSLSLQAPLSGAHIGSTSVTNSLSLHCTLFKLGWLFLGSSWFYRDAAGTQRSAWWPSAQKVHHGRPTSALRNSTTTPATRPLGTCSWSAFSWWPCEGGKSQSKGSREAMESASGQ